MQVKINGMSVEAGEDETVLALARRVGIDIPILCYDEELGAPGNCRLCVVEVNDKLKSSCDTKVSEGMEVKTETKRVLAARKLSLELLLSTHRPEPGKRNELMQLAEKHGVKKSRFPLEPKTHRDDSSPSISVDASKCILCGKCVQNCQEVQTVNAICFEGRGREMTVRTAFGKDLAESVCVTCGQCSLVCPTGAITEVDDIKKVERLLSNEQKHVIVQTAPSVRASIGEEFGMPPGSLVTGKMVAGLRRLGFDKVFDTDFGADLTIVEEANELVARIKGGKPLPMITSCSPAWIKFIEHFYPQLLPHLSTCKSPHQMFGAIAKTYYAKRQGLDAKDIAVVSIMPCTAKKFECQRPEISASGARDVDAVLTTREAAALMKKKGVHLPELEDEAFDDPLGIATGAGLIFGVTGGVMEAALRTACELHTGKTLLRVDFDEVRGMDGVREASIQFGDTTLRVAVAHGLGNARKLLDGLARSESPYHFIEIMACPGGCLGGGGQPIPTNEETRRKRAEAIYRGDRALSLRKSHENPVIKKLYEEFLGEPNGRKAHKLLHTKYVKRRD